MSKEKSKKLAYVMTIFTKFLITGIKIFLIIHKLKQILYVNYFS